MALAMREITIESEIEHQVMCASGPRSYFQVHFNGTSSPLPTDSARYALLRFISGIWETMVIGRAFLQLTREMQKNLKAKAGFRQEITGWSSNLDEDFPLVKNPHETQPNQDEDDGKGE
jgi:hypothetical protein